MRFSDVKTRVVITCKSVESEKRRQNVKELLDNIMGTEYEAFAGKVNDIHSRAKDVIHRSEVGRAAVSLWMSHIAIWAAHRHEPYIAVFESDATMTNTLEAMDEIELPRVGLLYLDYQTTDEFAGKPRRSLGNITKDVIVPVRPLRTHAYIVSNRLMNSALNRRIKVDRPFDWALLEYIRGINYGGLKERNWFSYIDDVSTIMINGVKQ